MQKVEGRTEKGSEGAVLMEEPLASSTSRIHDCDQVKNGPLNQDVDLQINQRGISRRPCRHTSEPKDIEKAKTGWRHTHLVISLGTRYIEEPAT